MYIYIAIQYSNVPEWKSNITYGAVPGETKISPTFLPVSIAVLSLSLMRSHSSM